MHRLLRGSPVLLAASIAMIPAIAGATPSSGVTAQTLTQGDIPAVLAPFVGGAKSFVVREITIAPGGTTGWHFHDGRVMGVIRQGVLTHPGPDCVPAIYSAGEIIDEAAGSSNVHEGNNLGTVPVVMDVVYFVQEGKPLFEDAPAPACAE